jgi:class 3 adenylate cyclase
MELRTRYATASDGVKIAYATLGEGPTYIQASMIWGDLHLHRHVPMAQLLNEQTAAAGVQLVVYDVRGMGSSDRSESGYGIGARMLDIDAVADAINANTFFLGGFGSGTGIAVAYAAAHPERVSKLVLANGYVRGKDWYGSVPSMRLSAQLQDLAEEEWEIYTKALASAAIDFADAEAATTLAAAFRSSTTPSEAVAFMRDAREIDVTDRLALIRAPTLVVHITPILSGTLPLMREMAATIPDAQLIEVEVGSPYVDAASEFLLGTSAGALESPSPSPFRTVLFTDLVRHAEIMHRLGDAKGRTLLREHETITRELLREHGGTEVKTMGDGFMASFGSVTKAVECAIALQGAFADREGEPLSVRVGLNAGEPIEEEGDLFGATVILASRIAGKAEGGEILVSDNVRSLCSGKGFLFSDRGEFVAKGFEEPMRVYEVRWREDAR